MEEIWKDIKGYEGLYKCSNLGEIYNIKKQKIVKTTITPYGYEGININKNKKINLQEFIEL